MCGDGEAPGSAQRQLQLRDGAATFPVAQAHFAAAEAALKNGDLATYQKEIEAGQIKRQIHSITEVTPDETFVAPREAVRDNRPPSPPALMGGQSCRSTTLAKS